MTSASICDSILARSMYPVSGMITSDSDDGFRPDPADDESVPGFLAADGSVGLSDVRHAS